MSGYRVGRVRLIFSLAEALIPTLFNRLVPTQLAYVEWYTPFSNVLPPHGLHKVIVMKERDGGRICSIIPVANIKRSVESLPTVWIRRAGRLDE